MGTAPSGTPRRRRRRSRRGADGRSEPVRPRGPRSRAPSSRRARRRYRGGRAVPVAGRPPQRRRRAASASRRDRRESRAQDVGERLGDVDSSAVRVGDRRLRGRARSRGAGCRRSRRGRGRASAGRAALRAGDGPSGERHRHSAGSAGALRAHPRAASPRASSAPPPAPDRVATITRHVVACREVAERIGHHDPRRGVEPLGVVDREDDASPARRRPQHRQRSKGDRCLVEAGRYACRGVEAQLRAPAGVASAHRPRAATRLRAGSRALRTRRPSRSRPAGRRARAPRRRRARATPSSQRVVLPMPASPSISRSAGAGAASQRAIDSSSGSRPTIAVLAAGGAWEADGADDAFMPESSAARHLRATVETPHFARSDGRCDLRAEEAEDRLAAGDERGCDASIEADQDGHRRPVGAEPARESPVGVEHDRRSEPLRRGCRPAAPDETTRSAGAPAGGDCLPGDVGRRAWPGRSRSPGSRRAAPCRPFDRVGELGLPAVEDRERRRGSSEPTGSPGVRPRPPSACSTSVSIHSLRRGEPGGDRAVVGDEHRARRAVRVVRLVGRQVLVEEDVLEPVLGGLGADGVRVRRRSGAPRSASSACSALPARRPSASGASRARRSGS